MPQLALKTHLPSPSTTCYTVSNATARSAPVPKVLHVCNLAMRVTISGLATVLLAAQLRLLSRVYDPLGLEATVYLLIARISGEHYSADGSRWWMLTLMACAILWVCSRRSSVEESLLVIRGLGIQTSTSSTSYLSTPTTRFIPTAQVQDIFIHEAFIGFEVKFYLAVIVEGEQEAVVVFPKLLPRRDVLEQVWRGARATLGWSKS